MSDIATSKSLERKSSEDSSTGSSFENVDAEVETREQSDVDQNDETAVQDVEEVDPLEAPMKKEQEKFYTQADSHKAIRLLVMFSAAMFILPLLTMFTLYHYVFLDYFHLPADQAMLYSGLCGMLVVVVIVASFVYTAYKEEQQAEAREKAAKED